MHVAEIKKTHKGKQYVTTLVRRTFREEGKVKHETIANISGLPQDLIESIRVRLKTGQPLVSADDQFTIERTLPHGNVVAVLGTMKTLGIEKLLAHRSCRERQLVLAMIADRILSPGSKLSCSNGLCSATAQNTLADELDLGDVDVHELYDAMDWLLKAQLRIESKLAKRHLDDGSLVLFDVSSSYYEGQESTLRQHGYSRDHRGDRPQIVYGLLCDKAGRPIAVEVFPGNTSDPQAFTAVVEKVRQRFGLRRVIFVGDRGMITSARIREDLSEIEGFDWVSALRTEGIRKLADAGHIPRSLFDETDLVEIEDAANFPGERLVVCRNPYLADKRARKRVELLQATESKLDAIVKATQRKKNPLKGADKIGVRVGQVIDKYKMRKHFDLTITEDSFSYARREEQIVAESSLDGLYVVRTSVKPEIMDSNTVVSTYKSLSQVERAFRSLKTVDLHIRPIFHSHDDRIRAHVFLCMLAYYVEWHMRECLREVLFEDEDREAAQVERSSVVSKAERSKSARAKDCTRTTSTGLRVQSFQSVLLDLATLCRHVVRCRHIDQPYKQLTDSTPQQRRYLELLNVTP
jgi:transposase